TTIYYGPVELALEGAFQQGRYQLAFNSRVVPMSFLRDNSDLLMMLSGIMLPEIWNTAGSLALDGTISQSETRMAVAFNEAGLSWQGGDFPVYDMHGQLLFSQQQGGEPRIETRNLTFRYGNSPVAVDVDSDGRALRMTSNGVVSRLAVNHFLGNPRS